MRSLGSFTLKALASSVCLAACLSAQTAPVLAPGGVVNAADYTAEFAPGGIIAIFGSNFATGVADYQQRFPVPTSLLNVEVELITAAGATVKLPLFLVSPAQINAQLPYNVTGQARLRVRNSAGVSREETITISATAPKLLTWTMDGKGGATATHPNYNLVIPTQPVRPNGWVTLWLIGLGAVNPSVQAGQAAASREPLNRVAAGDLRVTIGGKTAPVAFAGLAPGFAGLYQINFQVPGDVPAGLQPLVVTIGGKSSQSGVNLPVDLPAEEVLRRQIGPDGGVVAGGGVTLEVPAGAFDQPANVSVLKLLTEPKDPTHSASDAYKITGLPLSYSAPLTLRIPARRKAAVAAQRSVANSTSPTPLASEPESLVEGETVLAVVTQQASQTVGEGPKGIPARVEGDTIVVTLPPLPDDESGKPRDPTILEKFQELVIQTIGMMRPWRDISRWFDYWAPAIDSRAVLERIQAVNRCLERAWERLGAMGFDTGLRRTKIEVYLYPFKSLRAKITGDGALINEDEFTGHSHSQLWGAQNIGLSLNYNVLDQPGGLEEVCATGAHELMHIMQALYDPRGRVRQTWTHSPWLWLTEASAVWFERAVIERRDYIPEVAKAYLPFIFGKPLEMMPGWLRSQQTRHHGYAASLVMQFLDPVTPTSGGNLVAEVNKLMAEKAPGLLYDSSRYTPVEALLKVVPDLPGRWPEFARKLVEGTLYDGTEFPEAGYWLSEFAIAPNPERSGIGALVFRDGETATKSVTLPVGDLSVAFVFIHFPKWTSTLPADMPLTLSVDDPSGRAGVHLYRFIRRKWQHLQTFNRTYTYARANELVSEENYLLAVIFQPRAEPPYTGSTPITLRASLGQDVMNWLMQSRSVSVNVSAQVQCSEGGSTRDCGTFGPATFAGSFPGLGQFEGRGQKSVGGFPPFTPDYDARDNIPYQYEIRAFFNPQGTRLQQLELKILRVATRQSGGTTYETRDDVTLTIRGVDLTGTYDANSRVFRYRASVSSASSSLPVTISGFTRYRNYNQRNEVTFERTVSYTGFRFAAGNIVEVAFQR